MVASNSFGGIIGLVEEIEAGLRLIRGISGSGGGL